MYYELKWIEWPSGEEWFAIANTEQEIEQFVEDAANDEEHDFEYCGYFKVGEDTDRCRDCAYLIEAEDGSLICDFCRKSLNDIKAEDCSYDSNSNSVG